MQISILCIGRLKEDFFKKGIEEYCKRLLPFAKIRIGELKEEKAPKDPAPAQIEQIKQAESSRILAALPPSAYHIALSSEGAMLTSPQLSAKLQALALEGRSQVVFSIGGSWGHSDELLRQADFVLSFGKCTFPHQLMRLILAEQIYRCFMIQKNTPYHK